MRSCARTFRPDTTSSAAGDESARHKAAIVRKSVHYWLLRAGSTSNVRDPLWVLSRPSVAQGDPRQFSINKKTRHHTKQREKCKFLPNLVVIVVIATADVQFLNPPAQSTANIGSITRGIAALTDLQSVQRQRLY